MGHEAGADGFAGEDDNLNYWTSQLQAGTSLSSIRTLFADSGEAQTVLGTAYQSIFGVAMGSATLASAQTYLSGGGSLQQLEALWSSVQPQLLVQYQNIYGTPPSAAAWDAAVGFATTNGGSLTAAENAWAGQAETDISTLFINVLGHSIDSSGYAGSTDGLANWTSQLEGGMALGAIRLSFATSNEATGVIGALYRSTF